MQGLKRKQVAVIYVGKKVKLTFKSESELWSLIVSLNGKAVL
jgi:hypothetical protein